jgi:hypothetical protein
MQRPEEKGTECDNGLRTRTCRSAACGARGEGDWNKLTVCYLSHCLIKSQDAMAAGLLRSEHLPGRGPCCVHSPDNA